jgi:hypothetical protein
MGPHAKLELERERSASDLLSLTFDLYRRYPLLFPTLAAGVVVPYLLIVLLLTGKGPLQTGATGVAAQILPLLDVILVGPLISALHVHAVRDIAEGREPRLGEVARRGVTCLPRVSAVVVVSFIGTVLGFVALIVPGILLIARWSVSAQTAALEGGGWKRSLKGSAERTRGNYLHVLGLLLLVGLLSTIIWTPLFLHLKHTDTTVLTFLLGVVLRTLLASFGALASAVLYFELKAREAGAGPEPTPPLDQPSPTGSSGVVVQPTGHPLDPASYSDEDRPAGWYVIPETPWSMRYWAADGKGEWSSRKAKTPKDVREGWRDTRWTRDPAPGEESA